MIEMNDLITSLDPIISRVRTDKTGKKQNGRLIWTKDPLTDDLLKLHLIDVGARGVCPIKEGESTTQLALLDFDSHKGESTWAEMTDVAQKVKQELIKIGMNPVLWRSSGGNGLHLFIIWNEQQDAYSVREMLKDVLGSLGYKNGTKGVAYKEIEIFPKQNEVPIGGYGNQFILPLAGKSVPLNPMDLSPMDREFALKLVWPISVPVPIKERPVHVIKEKTDETDLENLENLLQFISPNEGYDKWVKVGMALHHETNGSKDGLDLWDNWSNQEGADYSGFDELSYKWDSFNIKQAKPATIGTLIHLAKQGGWKQDRPILVASDHSDIAHKVIDAKFRTNDGDVGLIRTQGQWFNYQGKHYEVSSDEYIRSHLRTFLDKALRIGQKGKLTPFRPTMPDISGVLDALKTATLIEKLNSPSWISDTEERKSEDIISMDNGLFHVPTRSLEKHTSDFFCLNTLPYKYEEKGKPVEFLKFLNSVWPNDQESIDTLQELFGYLLVADVSQQKMFLIKGPKRSGKGTLARILKALLAASNVCNPTLSNMAGSFGLQPLIGKLVAIVPDARIGRHSDKQAIVENLLMISGGDDISIPRKYLGEWNGQLQTRILILTNETPQLGDASGALASRFIVLEMKESFYGKEDLGLEKRLMAELPAIFCWALDGLDRLRERGKFIQPQSAISTVQELESLNSPLIDFVNTHCDLDVDFDVSKDVLFSTYKIWCQEQGISFPKTLSLFSRDLKGALPQIGISRLGSGANRKHVFTGIKVKDNTQAPEYPPPP